MEIKLHRGQMEILKAPERYKVAVMGRRYGKSRLQIYRAILDSLTFPGPVDPVSPETVLLAMPSLKQAKKVLWGPLVALAEGPLKPYGVWVNRSDFTLHVPGKPSIVVAGANDNNGDRLRGLRLFSVGLDEYQDMRSVWDTVIVPAMADTPGSRALITGTPKGKLNHLYKMFQRPLEDRSYRAFNHPTWFNPLIDPTYIEECRKTMPPRLFRQELEASFEDFPGKIFYELSPDNIASAPYSYTVIGVDWGDVNPAFVVLGLGPDNTWVVLEGWQGNTGTPVPLPVQEAQLVRLAEKYKPVATYCDPSRPSSILWLRGLHESYQNAVAGYNPIEEGLEQVHSLIYQRKLLFNPNVLEVVDPGYRSPQAIYDLAEAYHRLLDEEERPTMVVAPGQDDHLVDAIRYAIAQKKPQV